MSVAVVARNRPERLERTLHSVRAQSVQPWEVVVSDDSDPEHVEAVRRVCERLGCRYVPGPRRGLYANRNSAALACGGTHVRTMDDDHELPQLHFERCLEALERDRASIWVIGEWYSWDERDDPAPCPGELHPRGFSVPPRDPQRCAALGDGSTIFPREVFDRGIRYAEEFTFGIVYLELAERLVYLGYRIRHLDTTCVVHHPAAARSIVAPEMEEAARMYAMLCHSFLYRPAWQHQALTALELVRRLALGGSTSLRSLGRALAGFRARRAELGA